jgi:hypothetical protein
VTNAWPRQRAAAGSSAGLRPANPVVVGMLEVELEELELEELELEELELEELELEELELEELELEELELELEQLVEVSVGVPLASIVVGVDCWLTTGVVVPIAGLVGLKVDELL